MVMATYIDIIIRIHLYSLSMPVPERSNKLVHKWYITILNRASTVLCQEYFQWFCFFNEFTFKQYGSTKSKI